MLGAPAEANKKKKKRGVSSNSPQSSRSPSSSRPASSSKPDSNEVAPLSQSNLFLAATSYIVKKVSLGPMSANTSHTYAVRRMRKYQNHQPRNRRYRHKLHESSSMATRRARYNAPQFAQEVGYHHDPRVVLSTRGPTPSGEESSKAKPVDERLPQETPVVEQAARDTAMARPCRLMGGDQPQEIVWHGPT